MVAGQRRVPEHAVEIPGGRGFVGTDRTEIADDGETPVRRGKINPFIMGATAVTNAEFAAFIEATGYVTEAEQFGWSFVFWSDVPASVGPTEGVLGLNGGAASMGLPGVMCMARTRLKVAGILTILLFTCPGTTLRLMRHG